eukprot:2143576-Amphidinium_carterae.1
MDSPTGLDCEVALYHLRWAHMTGKKKPCKPESKPTVLENAFKPVKKQGVGSCVCSSCKRSSKDSSSRDKRHLEDVAWALRERNPKTKEEVCTGDACASCYEQWQCHYRHASWEDFCVEKNLPESKVQTYLSEAVQAAANPQLRKWKKQAVLSTQESNLLIERNFILLSASELRQALNCKNLTKAQTQNVPTLTFLNEQNLQEIGYMFADPNQPYRQAKLQAVQGVAWHVEEMSQAGQTWADQGEVVFNHGQKQKQASSSVTSLLASQSLVTLSEFLEAKASPTSK